MGSDLANKLDTVCVGAVNAALRIAADPARGELWSHPPLHGNYA
jgi:hypothetical protein